MIVHKLSSAVIGLGHDGTHFVVLKRGRDNWMGTVEWLGRETPPIGRLFRDVHSQIFFNAYRKPIEGMRHLSTHAVVIPSLGQLWAFYPIRNRFDLQGNIQRETIEALCGVEISKGHFLQVGMGFKREYKLPFSRSAISVCDQDRHVWVQPSPDLLTVAVGAGKTVVVLDVE